MNKPDELLFGLYFNETRVLVPLKSIAYSVEIINNVAKVTLTQIYENPLEKLIETIYMFPISDKYCFVSLEAQVGEKKIKGVIKEKEEAKKEYTKAKEEGATVALSEITEENKDVMKLSIGNINPQSMLTIRFVWLEELEISMNKFWRFAILSTLTPRYTSDPAIEFKKDKELLSAYPQLSSKSRNAYKWDIDIQVQSSSEITHLHCPSHKINIEKPRKLEAIIKLANEEEKYPNKDFVLYFRNHDIDTPQISFGINEKKKKACALVTFIPNFCTMDIDDALKEELRARGQNDIPNIKLEREKNKGRIYFHCR